MSIAIIPKYTTLFPDKEKPDIKLLLCDTHSSLVIGVLSFLNSSFYIDESLENQEKFFFLLIERLPIEERKEIIKNLLDFKVKYAGSRISIFPLYTNLKFIEWEILNYRNIEFTSTTADQELNILKAIMLFNEELDDSIRIRGERVETEYPFYKLIWENYLPQFEFSGLKLFFNQFLAGMDFISYLEKSYPKHLESYLVYLRAKDKNEFFKKVLEFLINGYNRETKNYRNHFPVEIINKNRLLEPLILDLNTLNTSEFIGKGYNKYFKGLRRYPIIKHPQGFIDIVNWHFVTDKMTTNALIFDFYHNSSIKKDVPFSDYKSEIGNKFSEKVIFFNLIRKTFNNKYIHLTETENKLINIDYYLRQANIIILIEYKDNIVPDEIKNGYFSQIKDYFDTTLIKNKNGKSKGVKQLINQIKTLNENFHKIENFSELNIEKKRIIIFPVIITRDISFSVAGLNEYLNKVFRNGIVTLKNDFFSIEDLVLIDLNAFIDWSELFQEEILSFPSVLNSYRLRLSYLKENSKRDPKPNNLIKSVGSFSQTLKPPTTKQVNETSAFKEIVKRLELT
jgi:hypothetical protein